MKEAGYCFGTSHSGCVAECFSLGHEDRPQASVLIPPIPLLWCTLWRGVTGWALNSFAMKLNWKVRVNSTPNVFQLHMTIQYMRPGQDLIKIKLPEAYLCPAYLDIASSAVGVSFYLRVLFFKADIVKRCHLCFLMPI